LHSRPAFPPFLLPAKRILKIPEDKTDLFRKELDTLLERVQV
jgi:hypothetical protein